MISPADRIDTADPAANPELWELPSGNALAISRLRRGASLLRAATAVAAIRTRDNGTQLSGDLTPADRR
ncbi:MAG: hypothetical protein ACRDKL_09875 [Solirubrobacteraceae bacterium]